MPRREPARSCPGPGSWRFPGLPGRFGQEPNSPVSRTFSSRQEFLHAVIDPFNARLATPLKPAVRALYADGDTVIAFFDATATAKDGKPYTNTYTWYLRMHDGDIIEATAFFDTIEFTDLWSRVTP